MIIDIHYPCGYVYRCKDAQRVRGVKFNGARPVKIVVCGGKIESCFYEKHIDILHPIEREGVFFLYEGKEYDLEFNYNFYLTLELIGVVDE